MSFRDFIQLQLSLINPLLDFVFPPYCLLCEGRLDGYERLICLHCWCALPVLPRSVMPLPAHSRGGEKRWYVDASLAVWSYSETLQHIIHLFKYRRKPCLSCMLGMAMAGTLLTSAESEVEPVLVPVPLHRLRLRERGYNQSELLAATITNVIALPIARDSIIRTRYTKFQAALNASQRVINIDGAFRVKNETAVADRAVLLVDDVFTTGTTANECARVLKAAGARRVVALTVARA